MDEPLKLRRTAEANLPTEFGTSTIVGFEEIATGRDHVALVYGDITTSEPVLSRIHSECLTGDTFFSLKCDCGHQLAATLSMIGQQGRGVLLYHRQEGRGIGLVNKIRAYALQDKGLDTVEANLKLGFKPDERDFTICADMFKLLGIKAVRLLTNNPQKVDAIKQAGISVVERVPIEVGCNSTNENYLKVKAEKLGHVLNRCHENHVVNGVDNSMN